MASRKPLDYPVFQAFDDNGAPLSSGTVEFFDAGTTDNRDVYSDAALSTTAPNPVTLNSRGEPQSGGGSAISIYLDDSPYKIVLKDSSGSTVRTVDNYIQPPGLSDNADYAIDIKTLSDLQGVDITALTDGDSRYMKGRSSVGDGGEGHFRWDSSDLSTEVGNDEWTAGEGDGDSFVAPASDKTGSSGAWRRMNESVPSIYPSTESATYLQTTSDIINGQPVSLFRFIDRSRHSGIRAKTDTNDVSVALQNAIDDGVFKMLVPDGKFYFENQVLYDTDGDGRVPGLILVGDGFMATRFVNAINSGGAGSALLKMTSGTTGGNFQFGGLIGHIGFEEASAGTDGHGIEYQGLWHQRFENLFMDELTGAGLKAVNSASDADSSASVLINHLRALDCAGPAFDSTGGTGGLTLHTFNSLFSQNCGGATYNVILDGVAHCRLLNTTVSGASAGPGFDSSQKAIRIARTNIVSRSVEIWGGEIGNSIEKGIVIEAVASLELGRFRLVKRAAESTFTHGIVFEDSASAAHFGVTIHPINLQIDDASPAFTYLTIGTGIDKSFKHYAPANVSFDSGNTFITFSAGAEDQAGYIEGQNGEILVGVGKNKGKTSRTISSTGTHTLDPEFSSWQRWTFDATGSHTIEADAGDDAQEMVLSILNNSGGSITITFGSGFGDVTGYSDPSNGARTHAKFIYDNQSASWRQVGSWT